MEDATQRFDQAKEGEDTSVFLEADTSKIEEEKEVDPIHADDNIMRKHVDTNSMDVIHAAAIRWDRSRDEHNRKMDKRMNRIVLKQKMAIKARSIRHKKEKLSRKNNRRK